MACSGLENLLLRTTTNNSLHRSYSYILGQTFTVGRWYDFSTLNRMGPQNAFAGSALSWTSCNESTGNGTQVFGIQHGGNISPATKHIINMSTYSTGTSSPGNLLLVDLQGYWPGISTNSLSTQNLSGTPTIRYTNGQGCQLYFVSTTASGASAHNMSISYTGADGTPSKSLRYTVSMTPSAITTHISHSGTSAGNFGPFLPLAAGETGVQNVASVTFSAASGSGAGALCLARPLISIPITVGYSPVERDAITYFPSLPQVKDGACLVWLYFAYAAAATGVSYMGNIDFAWG